jgi:hypothetical protein
MQTVEITAEKALSPAHLMQVGMDLMAAKTLLAAIKPELFTSAVIAYK